MSNFAGIEFFNTKLNDNDVLNSDEVLEQIAEQVSADMELVDAMEDVDEIMDGMESFEASMDSLQRLHDIIARDGISKGLIEFADPDGFLTEQIDGFPAVESLDVAPTLDSNAVAAMEGFKETMKKWGEGIKKFFKSILERIKQMIAAVVRVFSSYEKTLASIKKKLKDAKDLDPELTKAKKIKSLDAGELDKVKDAVATASKVTSIKDLDGLLKDAGTLKLLGYKYEEGKDGEVGKLESEDSELKPETRSLNDLKLNTVAAAQVLLKEASNVAATIRQIPAIQKGIQAAQKQVEANLKSLEKADAESSKTKEEKKAVKETMDKTKMLVKLLNATTKLARTYVNNAITASNAIASTVKKD